MTRILLVTANARYTHSSLALRYLRNALEAQACAHGLSVAVELREYQINERRIDLVRDIALAEPDLIMISAYIWNAELFKAIIPDIKKLLPRAGIVAGGPEVAYDAAAWLNALPELDLAVRGHAEGAAAALAAARFELSAFPGRVLDVPPIPFAAVPFPYRDEDFTALERRYIYYESSRGCPFRCAYCLSSRGDQNLDDKDAATSGAELELIAAREPALVKLVDRSFNARPERARELWERLIRIGAGRSTRYHFELYPTLLGDEDFRLLERAPAGLFQFELGVQTVHAATRAAIGRGGDWEREREAIRRLVALGNAPVHLDLIAGLPGEGKAAVAASLEELMALGAGHVQLGFLKGIPGTALREGAAAFGASFQASPPYEVLATDAIAAAELGALKGLEELLDGLYNSGRFRDELAAAAASLGGYFPALESLRAYALGRGFDLRTRDRVKLGALLTAWRGGDYASGI